MKDISCLIGITMLIGSLSMTIMKKDTTIFRKFNDLLNKEQKMIYEEIVRERLMIYFTGMIIGLGLGIYYYTGSKDKYKLCKFLAIIYVVKLGFYYFYPKKPLMLYSLTDQKQVEAWANIYEEMKSKYKKSLMIGFVGYLLISYNY
mgnify:FL=1|jgi:hypothetical protein|tara:strand:- start:388 stop:825 length:438 start_codon:yes stop_codon:yes gene_type:complete